MVHRADVMTSACNGRKKAVLLLRPNRDQLVFAPKNAAHEMTAAQAFVATFKTAITAITAS